MLGKSCMTQLSTERKRSLLTRLGTMLLACLGLYPQVRKNLEIITVADFNTACKKSKCLFVLVYGYQHSAYGVWNNKGRLELRYHQKFIYGTIEPCYVEISDAVQAACELSSNPNLNPNPI